MPSVDLTAKAVDALRVDANRQIDFFDRSVAGFAVRVAPSGRKTWCVFYRAAGRLRRMTLGTYPTLSLAEARARARQTLHAVATGLDPAESKRQERLAETFADLADAYLERHARAKKRSWREDERLLGRELLPVWRTRKAKDVSRRDVVAVLDTVVTRGAGIQANRLLALVRKVFNFGIERGTVEFNPCQGISAPARETARSRVLSREEMARLWRLVRSHGKRPEAYFKLIALTAQRPGEVRRAQWLDIDLEAHWWTIPSSSTKNGFSHRVYLVKEARGLLQELRQLAGSSPWVFPGQRNGEPVGDFKKVLERVRKEGTIEFVPHDLRRTSASLMTGAGVPRLTVSKILNHVEKGVTAVYDRHSYDAEKRDALLRLEKLISEPLMPLVQSCERNFSRPKLASVPENQ